MTNLASQDTFQLPDRYAPSGTLEFDDGERVDFHAANPDLMTPAELARFATELAAPSHHVVSGEAEKIDTHRIEFGSGVVDAVEHMPPAASALHESIKPQALASIGAVLVALRARAASRSADAQER